MTSQLYCRRGARCEDFFSSLFSDYCSFLDVAGCILEAWLANKGLAVQTQIKYYRLAERIALQNAARCSQWRLKRIIWIILLAKGQRATNYNSISRPSNSNSDTDVSIDTSIVATSVESGTPPEGVLIPSRYRSGTTIARRVWE
ncbi:hypothetical protein B0H34DRAFT_798163 [Crassisporium funariophilum]|nr:hypothetical protein B0H34DRAFT_798163 [Crassisporium funariophilum]